LDGGYPTGGSGVLAGLLDEHGGAVISDLLHYYQVDIRQFFTDPCQFSPRYLLELVLNLPADSAYVASVRGGRQYRGWDETRYTLVSIAEALNTLQYMYLYAHSDPKKSKPKPPLPYPTPDRAEELKRAKKGPPKPGSFAAIAAASIRVSKMKRKAAGWQDQQGRQGQR